MTFLKKIRTYVPLEVNLKEYKRLVNGIWKNAITSKKAGILYSLTQCVMNKQSSKSSSQSKSLIDSELNILFELINIKISEVSSARVSLTNLIISIVAIIIALISNP